MTLTFEKNTFKKRIKSMLGVDFRRMLVSPVFYIMVGASLIMPILILVMTGMMDGMVSVDPQTGAETVMEGFKNVWQIIGSVQSGNQTMSMDITSMCNINMMYFATAILICLFIGQDFRSGYCKNLFTVRSNKVDYVISKTLVGFIGGAFMIIAFFLGMILGGTISGVSFEMKDVTTTNIIMCLLSKIFLVLVFDSIFVLMSIIAKEKIWLSLVVGLGAGMLLFMMVPIITPLNSGFINIILTFIGGGLFSLGLGAISNIVLKKTNLI